MPNKARRFFSIPKTLLALVFASAFLAALSSHAQTTESWASASDNFTNGPVGGDWSPAIADSPTNWPNNFNGSASSLGGYIIVMTNSGTCDYLPTPAGDPDYTNVINDLILGATANGLGGGGIANTFNMSGGSLTLADPNGPAFAVGGIATGGKVGQQCTNVFTMTDGQLIATNAIANVNGGCVVGLSTNNLSTINFNGGTAILSDLIIGGHGTGIVNINGGNVTLLGTDTNGLRPISFDTMAAGNGTLNMVAGTLNVTNSQIDLGHAAISKLLSTINVSGGTFNLARIQFATGNAAAATNIVNLSGGTMNFSGGTGRNGTTESNFFNMSGGTISCLPGFNPTFAGGLTHWRVNTSPGPGVVTFAPLSGQSMTFPDMSGAGSVNAAGPGVTIVNAAGTYTGNTTVSGGILSLSTAGSIAGPIIIAANATFDVSEQVAPYALASGQTLSNSGSTAIIDGSLNTASGILSLLYASGTPSLTITTNNSANTNAASVTLTLSPNTTLTINNTGSRLVPGSYLIISVGAGAVVAGVPPGAVTVTGGGIQAGNTAALSIGGDNQLYLVVASRPPPPAIGQEFPMPYTNLFTLYAGSSPTFSVQASSSGQVFYQWFTNGAGVAGAVNSSLTLTNISAGSLSTYCVVSNLTGAVTSMVWTASVISSPAAYPSSVLALNPVGYWRLNDVNLNGSDNGGGDNGSVANDYAGGNDGIYTNVTLGQQSYNPSADPSDSSALFGNIYPYENNLAGQIQGIDFAVGSGTNAEFTVEAWVLGQPGNEFTGGAVVTKGIYGVNDEFNLGMDTASTHRYRFYVRSASGTVYTADSSFAPDNNWHHLAGVCDEANGKVLLYIDGLLAASTSIPVSAGEYEADAPLTIGAGITNNSPDGYTLQFFGNINDVAVYKYALSQNQVGNQFVTGVNSAPYFSQPPPATFSVGAGGTLIISPVTAIGTPSVNFQWYDVNGNVISGASGATNAMPLDASLVYNNVPPGWNNGQLKLTVSNTYGTTNVYVTLQVAGAPVITTNLPGQVSIGQGQTYNYAVGAVASAIVPLYYQWYQGGSPIQNQTNSTLAATASGTYYVILTNFYGSATSVVSTLTVLPPIGNYSYSTNILGMKPVGYWPMHEIESPAPGDTETNYGFLGLLGTGFYADWVAPGAAGGMTHDVPGALANNFDTAVAFPGETAAGNFVNCMSIPHSAPQTTLNPPFSVECWFYPSNDVTGDIWSQCGYEGLNSGSYGGGQGNIAGIRLFWNGPSFYLYTYYNLSTLHQVGHIHELPGSWYHLVVTCDASTNMALYVNGQLQFTNHQAGLYTPDYWSPLTFANGKGYNNSQPGNMDEFAIYTNALDPLDIAAHYNDGTGGNPAQYVTDVENDSPAVYLRMNSPAYTGAPPASSLPVLVNYGSAGNNGVYSAATAPGLINGASFGGFPVAGVSGTSVADLSGVSSFADAGYAPAYNPVGSNAFSVTALFRGNPGDERNQTIVGHSTSSWRLWQNTTGNLVWQIAGATLTSSGMYNDGAWHQVVAVYSPASDPAVTGTNLLYVDGLLDNSLSSASTNGIPVGSTADVIIGSDPQYTNNPVGLGQQFAGDICEVALFTNAITAAQVAQLSSADQTAPFIDGQPISGRSVYGGPGTYVYFGVDAGGTLALGYQWYFNSTQSYSGATKLTDGSHYSNSGTLEVTVTNLTAADSGYYFVVVTNNIGSVTSILASLSVTVNPNATNLVESIANNQLTLSWPADHTGWELEVQTNTVSSGLGTNWVPVTSSTNVNQIVIPVNLSNGCIFYRLIYPPQ
ncbi:MAG TPA: LamG-like jellyroll fold domain-containing protein [Verrucomicrobiae bacterium]|nr:LamG-like jellyroll fold domain-containing protein [Verrucomicrobiae bacterium]